MDGYISKLEVYQGKVKDINQTPSEEYETSHIGLGEQVVQSMTADLFSKGHEVYFDNFFTSVLLMEYLMQNGVNAAGTVLLN